MTPDRQFEWRDTDADDLAAIEILQLPPGQSCPPAELIQASGAGTLSPQIEARVAAHVAHCAACRALTVALDDPTVIDLTADERRRIFERVRTGIEVDKRDSRRRAWSWVAAAMVVATVGWLLVWPSRHPPAPVVFDLDKPELPSLNLSRPDELTTERRERADLEQALGPYRANDYGRAAQQLAAFVERYPRSAAGHFFLGVNDLFLGRDATAVGALESADGLTRGTDTPLARQTSWYLALAYVRTGQPWSARVHLRALCDGRAEFGTRACDGLQTLPVAYRLSGVVTSEAGEPLDGATVGEYLMRMEAGQAVVYRTPYSARTDAGGRYSVSGVPESPRSRTNLRASKPGYFSAPGGVAISPEMRADFRLTPWIKVALDDVVKGTLEPGVASCAAIGQPCRQFAVSVPRTGTLDVSLATAVRDGIDLWVETPTGEVYSPPMQAPLRLSVRVFAGAVCQITVVTYAKETRQFELTMRLR